LFSRVIDQQPGEDDDIVAPTVVHGPPISTDGENVLGGEIVGGDAAGAGIVGIKMPEPATSGIGLGTGPTGSGLSPPLPISTEPNGIPAGRAPPGDGVAIADDGAAAVELVPQVPEVAEPPGNGIPIAIPPPSKVVAELEISGDGHATPSLVIVIEPAGTGLRPADGSSVAPMGIPAGEPGVSAVMPSGEVVPIAGTALVICATAGTQQIGAARIEAIKTDRILGCIAMRQRCAKARTSRRNERSSLFLVNRT
jgi:hypothetical protein